MNSRDWLESYNNLGIKFRHQFLLYLECAYKNTNCTSLLGHLIGTMNEERICIKNNNNKKKTEQYGKTQIKNG